MEAGRDFQNANFVATYSGYPTPAIVWYDSGNHEILQSGGNEIPKNSLYSGGIDHQSGFTSLQVKQFQRNNGEFYYYELKVYNNQQRRKEKKIWIVDYVKPYEFKIWTVNKTDTSIGIQCNITGHPSPSFFNLEACFEHENGSSFCDLSLDGYRVSFCLPSIKLTFNIEYLNVILFYLRIGLIVIIDTSFENSS